MNDIEKAIELLESEGYFVRKITKRQIADCKRCEEKEWEENANGVVVAFVLCNSYIPIKILNGGYRINEEIYKMFRLR